MRGSYVYLPPPRCVRCTLIRGMQCSAAPLFTACDVPKRPFRCTSTRDTQRPQMTAMPLVISCNLNHQICRTAKAAYNSAAPRSHSRCQCGQKHEPPGRTRSDSEHSRRRYRSRSLPIATNSSSLRRQATQKRPACGSLCLPWSPRLPIQQVRWTQAMGWITWKSEKRQVGNDGRAPHAICFD